MHKGRNYNSGFQGMVGKRCVIVTQVVQSFIWALKNIPELESEDGQFVKNYFETH